MNFYKILLARMEIIDSILDNFKTLIDQMVVFFVVEKLSEYFLDHIKKLEY